MERPPVFKDGETKKIWSEKFQKYFVDSLLDKHWKEDEFLRCEDVLGNKAWIVGYHKEIDIGDRDIPGWWWTIRETDLSQGHPTEIGVYLHNFKWIENHEGKKVFYMPKRK